MTRASASASSKSSKSAKAKAKASPTVAKKVATVASSKKAPAAKPSAAKKVPAAKSSTTKLPPAKGSTAKLPAAKPSTTKVAGAVAKGADSMRRLPDSKKSPESKTRIPEGPSSKTFRGGQVEAARGSSPMGFDDDVDGGMGQDIGDNIDDVIGMGEDEIEIVDAATQVKIAPKRIIEEEASDDGCSRGGGSDEEGSEGEIEG